MVTTLRSLVAEVAREIGARTDDGRSDPGSAAVSRIRPGHELVPHGELDSVSPADDVLREELVSALTNGETYFFRHPDQWEALRQRVLPAVVADKPAGARLELWSAGCATGEEPYTLAMALDELGLASRSDVLGSDVSRRALEAARAAVYGRWSLRGPQVQARLGWFDPQGGRYRLQRRLADRVSFRPINLLADSPYPYDGTADVILCRNVLLHMTRDAAATVARRLITALAPGGWLLLSPADPPLTGPGGLGVAGVEAVVFGGGGGIAYRRGRQAAGVHRRPTRRRDVTDRPSATRPATEDRRDVTVSEPGIGEIAAHRVHPPAATHAAAPPRDATARLAEARASLGDGSPDAALTHATSAAFLDPDLVAAQLVAGIAAWRLDEPLVARRAFRRAATLLTSFDPDDVVPLSDGEVAGRLRQLVEDYLTLIERRPVPA